MQDQFIDLHGQKIEKAVVKTVEHIDRLKIGLSNGKISPNYGNQHVFKIICGAGNNSKTGKGMIKEMIY